MIVTLEESDIQKHMMRHTFYQQDYHARNMNKINTSLRLWLTIIQSKRRFCHATHAKTVSTGSVLTSHSLQPLLPTIHAPLPHILSLLPTTCLFVCCAKMLILTVDPNPSATRVMLSNVQNVLWYNEPTGARLSTPVHHIRCYCFLHTQCAIL